MGFSISWLAFKGPSVEMGLQELNLSGTGKTGEWGRKSITGRSLPGGWHLVIAPRCGHPLVSEDNLAGLAKKGEIVVCGVEEHVMFSMCESWRDGARIWRVEHDAQQGTRHLATSGALPAMYAAALQRANQEQDAEDAGPREVDFFFEVPLQMARELAGFKHDEENQAIDDDGFEVYISTSTEHVLGRKWWQVWK